MCGDCKAVRTAMLQRLERAHVEGLEVERALVYVCEACGHVVATPQVSAGRVFAAAERRRSVAAPTELRVPEEAEDLAYAVYAALGLRPSGDVFALPIALGLRQVGMRSTASDTWRALDRLDKSLRARPVLSDELVTRVRGLQKTWNARDLSTVARWLLVAGAQSLGLV